MLGKGFEVDGKRLLGMFYRVLIGDAPGIAARQGGKEGEVTVFVLLDGEGVGSCGRLHSWFTISQQANSVLDPKGLHEDDGCRDAYIR